MNQKFHEPPQRSIIGKMINSMQSFGILARYIVLILPVLAIIAVPGVVGQIVNPNAAIANVPLLWWSVWAGASWLGLWATKIVTLIAPPIFTFILGIGISNARQYVDYIRRIDKFLVFVGSSVISFLLFSIFLQRKAFNQGDGGADNARGIMQNLLLSLMICAIILAAEKLLIQIIAVAFHRKTFEDRIRLTKYQVSILTTLYAHSRNTEDPSTEHSFVDLTALKHPRAGLRRLLDSTKNTLKDTTSALGNIASELIGQNSLQQNTPHAMVVDALDTARGSRAMARRIFYSFAPPGTQHLHLSDIEPYFQDKELAESAFYQFDKDGNGDLTAEELELACVDIHRERKSITNSLRDLDSAVGNLDRILMIIYYVVVLLVFLAVLNVDLKTMLAAVGSSLLAISFVISTSAQEVLGSMIFLFFKHPFDVGDRVDIDGVKYTVKEMNLLSTVFRRTDGCEVQAPNALLNTKLIENIRRSNAMSERITIDVAFWTSFELIEKLRANLIRFLEHERRDFYPQLEISIFDMEDLTKLTLVMNVRHKSNWQNEALRATRRNKFMCALKNEVSILGLKASTVEAPAEATATTTPGEGSTAVDPTNGLNGAGVRRAYTLSDRNAIARDIAGDVFDEDDPGTRNDPRLVPQSYDERDQSQSSTLQVPDTTMRRRRGPAQGDDINMEEIRSSQMVSGVNVSPTQSRRAVPPVSAVNAPAAAPTSQQAVQQTQRADFFLSQDGGGNGNGGSGGNTYI